VGYNSHGFRCARVDSAPTGPDFPVSGDHTPNSLCGLRCLLSVCRFVAFCCLPITFVGACLCSPLWPSPRIRLARYGHHDRSDGTRPPARPRSAAAAHRRRRPADVKEVSRRSRTRLQEALFDVRPANSDPQTTGFRPRCFWPVSTPVAARPLPAERSEAAKADFDEAIKENAQHLPALIYRGKLYLSSGRTTSHWRLRTAKEVDRSNPD